MLIKTAGYLWNRQHVDWTQRRLVGSPEEGKDADADFADQSGIYGLYSANHECIYIGQAGRGERGLFDRLKDHAIEDDLFCFWERFTWFGFYSAAQIRKQKFDDVVAENVTLTEALNTIESVGICLALPRFNRRWSTGFGHVEWYYQVSEYEHLKNSKRHATSGA